MITFSKHSKIVIAIIAVASLFNFTVYAETTCFNNYIIDNMK